MINEVNGLPAHVLLVHGIVVGVPLAALLTVLTALWPAARRRLGVVTPLFALAMVVAVPITENAGKWLQQRLMGASTNPLVQRHADIGEDLWIWVIGLAVVAVAAWALPLVAARTGNEALTSIGVRAAVGLLAVGFAVVSVVQTVRIGEAGSKATFSGIVCAEPIPADGVCAAPLGS